MMMPASAVEIEQWRVHERPPLPSTAELPRLRVHLVDDLGTAYRPVGVQFGGENYEWRADWVFAPAVPAAARRLVVTSTGERTKQVEVPLD